MLTAGLRNDEVRGGFGLVTSLLPSDDFLIDPLPNLLFTRDSSVWIRDKVAITSLAMPARARESQLTELIYTRPPALRRRRPRSTAGAASTSRVATCCCSRRACSPSASGSVRRPPGSSGWPARSSPTGAAHTVLAVPIAQERATMHLDTVCTMVDVDKIVMYPNVADHLTAHAVTAAERRDARSSPTPSRSWSPPPRRWRSTRCTRSTPASTRSPPSASSGTTATTPSRSRRGWPWPTSATSRPTARLEEAGIEVIAIAGSELGSGRGGPRCMSCPIARDGI